MVKLYSKPGCGQCIATKRAFDKKGVEYQYIDVTADEDAYRRVTQELGYQGVPVVETDTEHWNGFRPDKIQVL